MEAEKCIALDKNWPKGYYRQVLIPLSPSLSLSLFLTFLQAAAELKLGRLEECEKTLTLGLSLSADDKFLLETQKALKEEKEKREREQKEKGEGEGKEEKKGEVESELGER